MKSDTNELRMEGAMPDPVEMIAKTLRRTHPQLSTGSIQMLAEGVTEIAERAITNGWDLTQARLTVQGNKKGTNPLADLLRQARLAAGMTQRQAAVANDFSPAKIMRIENGMVAVTLNDVRGMIESYNLRHRNPKLVEDLLSIARANMRTHRKRD